jgi:hypothetical protein
MRWLLVALTLGALAGIARAQPDDARKAAEEQFAALPPEVQLGARAEIVRRQWPAVSVVVVVQDAGDALEAMARWSIAARFPVLIDDGSDAARERIGRFVRAFEPERVYRWTPDERILSGSVEKRLDEARRRVWGVSEEQDLAARYASINFTPPGAVVTSERDRAWVGGAALEIGRGQPVVWVEPDRGRIGGVMDEASFVRLDRSIVDGLDGTGFAWRGLGDDLDALTIALNVQSRVPSPDGEGNAALTDRLGRFDDRARYAWTSMIFGDASESLYMAMCGLFLEPTSAWLFDGYSDKANFAQYDVAAGAKVLESIGIETIVDVDAAGSVMGWRNRARSAIDAGLIHVNSMGNNWFFAANDGRLVASDVPMLGRPAIVHFIHSFSAQDLDAPWTIGSAWLRRGAYAYVGSVQEPYLTAFLTPESLFGRMAAPAAWAAAARQDVGKVWKVNVFGDALITLGPPAPRANVSAAVDGCDLLEKALADAMRERRFDDAAWDLSLLGRDTDLVRLAQAVDADGEATLTPGIARCALPAAVRMGQRGIVLDLWEALPQDALDEPDVQDWLWLALRQTLGTTQDVRTVTALRGTLGPYSVSDDVIAVADLANRLVGAETAKSILSESGERAKREQDKRRINAALRKLN